MRSSSGHRSPSSPAIRRQPAAAATRRVPPSKSRAAALILAVAVLWLEPSFFTAFAEGEESEAVMSTIRVAQPVPRTLDPHRVFTSPESAAIANIYESLTFFNAEGQLQPVLAESWERTDEKTWRFDLRHGVRFQNGELLTAQDVQYTFERGKSKGYNYIPDSIATVRPLAEHSLEIVTSRPDPDLPRRLVSFFIVSSRSEADLEVSANGTGPFRVREFRSGEKLSLVANRDYWRGSPALSNIEYLSYPSQDAALEDLTAGKIDLTSINASAAVAIDQGSDHLWVFSVLSSSLSVLLLDTDHLPLSDTRIRKALDLTLDRREIAEGALLGYARPCPRLPISLFSDHEEDPRASSAPDLEAARKLLDAAGYPNGLSLSYGRIGDPENDSESVGQIHRAIREQLSRVGIAVDFKYFDSLENLLEARKQGAVQVFLIVLVDEVLDATNIYASLYHSRRAYQGFYHLNGQDQNLAKKIDELIDLASQADQASRAELLREVSLILAEERFDLPILRGISLWGGRKTLEWQPRFDTLILGVDFGAEVDLKK